MKRFAEKFAYEGGKVDRSGPRPIVRGVLLCGPVSANRRRYGKEAFAGDQVKKYADRPVFLNHGEGRSGRRYEDQVGWIRNPRLRADGMPIGDIEVKPKHPLAAQFLDDAEHDPRAVGMSHVAHADSRRATDGWEEVHFIDRVESVDVVLDPATTRGLFESTRRRPAVTLTIRKLVSAVLQRRRATESTKTAARRLLREAEDLGLDDSPVDDAENPDAGDDAQDDDASDADVSDAVTSGFKTAIAKIVDKCLSGKMDWADGKAKVDKLFDAHATATEEARRRNGRSAAISERGVHRPTVPTWDSGGRMIPRWDN